MRIMILCRIYSRRLLKKSICGVAAAASMLNVQGVRLRLKPCRALHLELFEQPPVVVE